MKKKFVFWRKLEGNPVEDNFSEKPVTIERGEKIAQGVFVRIDKFEWEEVDEIRPESRGGFGSTDGFI